MASLRDESNKAGEEAREHAAKGTEAAKESVHEYKGAAQKEGLAAMKGAEGRYESAKEYTKQKSGEIADSAKDTKDSAVDSTVRAKDSVTVSPFSFILYATHELYIMKTIFPMLKMDSFCGAAILG
jgi:hypothetical protein